MANVFEIPQGSVVTPHDPEGVFVWPGVTGPVWGGLETFVARSRQFAVFPDGAWFDAIESAKRHAERYALQSVYVVRG